MPDNENNYAPLEDYFNSDIDFGFTAVDAQDVEGDDVPPPPSTQEVVSEVSSELLSTLDESIAKIESKLNALLLRNDEDEPGIDSSVDFSRIEGKLDQILAMENQELLTAVNEQGDNIRAVIDEVEERKKQLNEQYIVRMREVEKLIMPLLYHLKKNPDKEYIYWPDRTEKIDVQISKILHLTRGQ